MLLDSSQIILFRLYFYLVYDKDIPLLYEDVFEQGLKTILNTFNLDKVCIAGFSVGDTAGDNNFIILCK